MMSVADDQSGSIVPAITWTPLRSPLHFLSFPAVNDCTWCATALLRLCLCQGKHDAEQNQETAGLGAPMPALHTLVVSGAAALTTYAVTVTSCTVREVLDTDHGSIRGLLATEVLCQSSCSPTKIHIIALQDRPLT